MIFADFAKALSQVFDPRFRRVLWLGLGWTMGGFIAFAVLFWQLATGFGPGLVEWIPWIGSLPWIGTAMGVGGLLLFSFAAFFLMIPVASAISSIFLDDVAQAVEDRHYPGLPPLGAQPWRDAMMDTLSFFGVLVGANILALFAYVMLPFAAPFIFYALNGFLLGREYFTLAAMRREGRAGAVALRKQHGAEIWMAGILMALPLTIPVMNLIVPILGAATFTHLYHRLARTGSGGRRVDAP